MNGKSLEETWKSLVGETKSLRDRKRILDSLSQGDPTAIHALHDWHQDNPGNEQEEDVAHLREYVNTDQESHPSESHQSHHHFADTPEERSAHRARSAHAHLTGRGVSVGDLAVAVDQYDDTQAQSGRVEGVSDYVRLSQPGGVQPAVTEGGAPTGGWPAGDVHHHATDWLRRRQGQQNKQG